MKLIKHILVVIALMFAALPCLHAADHVRHDHDAQAGAQLCSSHTCDCHAGNQMPCNDHDHLKSPQKLTPNAVVAQKPSFSKPLFVVSTDTPLHKRVPVSGILAELRTVQLLI